MQPQPPPVTIVNPDGPPAMGDVLTSGSEDPPWRPNRVQKRLAGVLLVLAVLAASGGAWRQQVLHTRSLDRASIAAIGLTALYAADSDSSSDGSIALTVLNSGPRPVRLLTARLLLPGYGETRPNATIGSASQLTLALPLPATATCDPDRLAPVLTASLRVGALTSRGVRVARDLPLTAQDIAAIQGRARFRCGYIAPEQAFETVADDLRAEGDSVMLTLRVRNNSVLPFQLQRLSAFAGLSVSISPPLPLALRPEPEASADRGFTTIHVRLRLTSCAAMQHESARLRHEGQNPSGFSVFAAASLTATLVDDAGVHDVPIYPIPDSQVEIELPKAIADLLRCTDPS